MNDQNKKKVISIVKRINDIPVLYINGEPIEGISYLSYVAEKSCYEEFVQRGYRLFSVPAFFGGQTTNEVSQFPVPVKPIYDAEVPDYKEFDEQMEKIIRACPDAYVFPRVNVSVPKKWEEAHPEEVNDTGTDQFPDRKRACFSSDLWAEEVKRLLKMFIQHVEEMHYCDNIIGYQVAGGNTSEWFPFDQKGSIGKRSREKFTFYRKENNLSDTVENYYQFLSEITAQRICEFSSYVKELTGNRLVVGAFYGYTYELCGRWNTHHALRTILSCSDVDFICSPIGYMGGRKAGVDHPYMVALDSLKLHGKLYFVELDTRTHLTGPPNNLPFYNTSIWKGPEYEVTYNILKMHFAKMFINTHAGWWFDMWGGWYSDKRYMELMERFCDISKEYVDSPPKPAAEIAVFADEKAFAFLEEGKIGEEVCSSIRHALGLMSLPYAKYLDTDFELVVDKYKAVISLVPYRTSDSEKLRRFCEKEQLPFLEITEENASITAGKLRTFAKNAGVHVYADRDAAVEANEQFISLHTTQAGTYHLYVPEGGKLYDMYAGCEASVDVQCGAGESYLFKIIK